MTDTIDAGEILSTARGEKLSARRVGG